MVIRWPLKSGWWFETFFIFPLYWESHHPNWLIFFRGVQPSHQPLTVLWSLRPRPLCAANSLHRLLRLRGDSKHRRDGRWAKSPAESAQWRRWFENMGVLGDGHAAPWYLDVKTHGDSGEDVLWFSIKHIIIIIIMVHIIIRTQNYQRLLIKRTPCWPN